MTCPTAHLDLTVEEIDLIEVSLCQTRDILSDRRMSQEHRACLEGGTSGDMTRQLGERLVQIQQLLGRLDSQKSDFGAVIS
ncbi:hypothetical protein [Pseudophaeobacter sp.]|uniref:hypothetical protein n=1 Tax=Pseudophaeobacter sp. TaxID=1971739 RepID=UPI00405A27AF